MCGADSLELAWLRITPIVVLYSALVQHLKVPNISCPLFAKGGKKKFSIYLSIISFPLLYIYLFPLFL